MKSAKRRQAWGRSLRVALWATVAAVLAGCDETVSLGPGIRAADAPVQRAVADTAAAEPLRHGDFVLTPRAEFRLTAKLLSKRRYRWDAMAPLSPWDYAVGWGSMSDEDFLQWVDVTQGDRFLFRKLLHAGLPLQRIEESSANLHLVPADDALEAQLAAVPTGAIVTLAGVLVDARNEATAMSYTTSLSRSDTGAGACEILLVQSVAVAGEALAATMASNAAPVSAR